MAGSYPDNPSRRMAWDADGTIFTYMHCNNCGSIGSTPSTPPSGPWTEPIAAKRQELNNEDIALVYDLDYTDAYWLGWGWPEPRDIDGLFINSFWSNAWSDRSQDSTNGIDGTWTNNAITNSNPTDPTTWRTAIQTASFTAVTWVRLYLYGTSTVGELKQVHFYGGPSAGETPDRLIFLDTLNSDAEFTKPIDFGNVPRGQTQTRTFKVKNNSASKTINGVNLTIEDFFLNAATWYTFSDDDVTYNTALNLGNIAPGGTELVYLKQVVPDAETLALQTARIKAEHTSLT